jgi:tRNA 2-thiocytidine biosynthesis protein TtcA
MTDSAIPLAVVPSPDPPGAADSARAHAGDAAVRTSPRHDPRKAEFEANKLRKRLRRLVGEAIGDYGMIEPGDRVMVCLSGGKDSYALLDILLSLKDRAPFGFEVIAVNLDQKQPGFPGDVLPRYLESRGVPYRIEEQDTYSVVKRVIAEGGTMCSLCSRLRRGVLYRVAGEIGATRIALGHHRDDILATFFLNLFFGGKLKTMPPKLVTDDGKHVVIRPLAYVRERDLVRYAEAMAFPLIPCNLCGSQEHLQRKHVNAMLREWERKHPGRLDSIYNALAKVVPSHLMDRSLFDFAQVRATGRPEPEGDIAFDVDPLLERAAELVAGSAIPLQTMLSDDDDGAAGR